MPPTDLPPGVTEGMLPGNRPEDVAWEQVFTTIEENAMKDNMSDMDVYTAWKLGLAAWKEAKSLGAKFPHDPT